MGARAVPTVGVLLNSAFGPVTLWFLASFLARLGCSFALVFPHTLLNQLVSFRKDTYWDFDEMG